MGLCCVCKAVMPTSGMRERREKTIAILPKRATIMFTLQVAIKCTNRNGERFLRHFTMHVGFQAYSSAAEAQWELNPEKLEA